ncbi:MAG: ATP-binding protein, partial [Bacteroidota bacterium]
MQQLEQDLSITNGCVEQAMKAGDLSWWEWDYKTGYIKCDSNRSRLLGFQEKEIPTSFDAITKMIHPDDYHTVMDRITAHLDGQRPTYIAQFRLKTKSGDWRWFSDRGKIVETDILGKPVKLAGALIDINEGKIMEKELIEARDKSIADSRAKSSFLSSMSHEIYTPMAGVVGMAQILRQSKLSQEQNEYLDVIVKSATDLMSILNDILEYSKIEAGKVEFHDKPFSIHQVIEEIAATLADKAMEKGIDILSFQDPNIPVEVVGDPVRLRQILKIFTDNSLKFTEKGEIRIEAGFQEWDEDTVRIRFIIADTGIGISPEGIKKLFCSFSKLDSPESKKYGGGGLGLAIAKNLIDRMDGHIAVESTPGTGTIFTFSITFDRYKDSEVPDPMKKTMKGQKVLIIDTRDSHAELLRNYFERWDCDVEISNDPGEALKKMHHQAEIRKPYHLAVIEYQMAGINGLDFAAGIRKDSLLKSSKMLLTTSRMAPVSAVQHAAV